MREAATLSTRPGYPIDVDEAGEGEAPALVMRVSIGRFPVSLAMAEVGAGARPAQRVTDFNVIDWTRTRPIQR